MKYRNEDDKCYGVAGMALGLAVFDANDLFTGITVDADGFDCVQFTPEFYFAGNPRVNPKKSWQCIFSHYQVSMGLALANAICRKMVYDHGSVDRKMRQSLLDAACDVGQEMCQLEKDEVEPLFDKSFSYLSRLFSNADIRRAISSFASELKQRRSLTRLETSDLLHELNLL